MERSGLRATSGWNFRRCWVNSDEICISAIYLLLRSLSYLRMESAKKMGHPKRNLLKSWAPQMESTFPPSTYCWFRWASSVCGWKRRWTTLEGIYWLGHPTWNLHCCHLHDARSIGLPQDGVYRGYVPPWMESRLKQKLLLWMEWASAVDIAWVRFIWYTIILKYYTMSF
jgi:hypothetical protein